MKSEQAVITKFASHTGPPEFTCRKNWSQNILEKLASRRLLGYQPAELVSHHFTEYIHVDDLDIFKRGFRAAQTNSSIMRVTYRFLRKDSKYIALETRRHFFKQGFFGSTRSISTERVRMMDTFLDYKTENEMLKRKIAIANHYSEGTSNSNPSSSVYTQDVLNTYALSESISLLIGLHFDLGEHSCGISMGVEGKLFNTFSKESETLKPVKKRRNDDDTEHNCTVCSRTDVPAWRKGPRRPKKLCNACGLHWAKINKSQGTDTQEFS